MNISVKKQVAEMVGASKINEQITIKVHGCQDTEWANSPHSSLLLLLFFLL